MAKISRSSARRRAAVEAQTEPEDAFIAKVMEVTAFARKHSQTLVFGGAAIALALAAVLYYFSHQTNVRVQAAAELEQIQQAAGLGDAQTTIGDLTRYLERYGSTASATEAQLVLGQTYLENGQPASAITVLEEAAGSMRTPLALQAGDLLATAYEQAGRPEDAERQYLAISQAADMSFQVRDALAEAARIRTQAGDLQGAAALYEQILADLESDDPARGFFEMRLAEVRTGANA